MGRSSASAGKPLRRCGFTPVGNLLGSGLAGSAYRGVLIPIGALIGYYIVKAEPAVQVLNKQVEDITGGTVSQSMMNTALSIGVACAVMLSMVRVLTGISIYWILVPGYALALILARFVPSVFVGIAFDSGGVASGPMTSTFLLPLAMGACTALGDLSSMSRFVRVAYTKLNAVCRDTEAENVSQFFHILGAVEQQRGCCEVEPGAYEYTIYTSCCNATRGVYYYTTYDNHQITAVDLHRAELA